MLSDVQKLIVLHLIHHNIDAGVNSRRLLTWGAVGATTGLLESALPTATPHNLLDERADVRTYKQKSSRSQVLPSLLPFPSKPVDWEQCVGSRFHCTPL